MKHVGLMLSFIVTLATVHVGCNHHHHEASKGQASSVAKTPALDISEEERCAVVATILTAPLWGKEEGSSLDVAIERGGAGVPLVAATQITSLGRSPGPLFPETHACSDRLTVSPQGRSDAAFQISLARSADETLTFAVSGYGKSASGRLAKDPRGEWTIQPPQTEAREPRTLDAAPVESTLSAPVAPGIAEARFEVDTGGDIMGAPARQSGLVFVVRFGTRELRQTIASCDEVTRGSALGDLDNGVLDIADCGGLFRLVSRKGEVVVEQELEPGAPPRGIARLNLPGGIHRVVNSSKPRGR
ncbi:MAG: hypothetical protein KA712_05975 [Myxococcales bacterium]|nr:hypothetical protein [Myxococcales bacterium]